VSAQTNVPPVLRSVTVAVPIERAFDVFTRRIGDWWPLGTHGCFGEESAGVAFDGERLVERSRSGDQAVWAEVLVWEPPNRIAFTWHPGYAEHDPDTEIEVRFRARGGTTLVELEHTGWERLGERAEEVRSGYPAGWEYVLGRFEQVLRPGRH
jgi:uncharacterized protein YndB with AHSA1/START domain